MTNQVTKQQFIQLIRDGIVPTPKTIQATITMLCKFSTMDEGDSQEVELVSEVTELKRRLLKRISGGCESNGGWYYLSKAAEYITRSKRFSYTRRDRSDIENAVSSLLDEGRIELSTNGKQVRIKQ